MRYIYYFSWLFVGFWHDGLARLIFRKAKLLFWICKTSPSKQEQWKSNFNRATVDFPDGIMDWGAFALTGLVVFNIIFLPLFFYAPDLVSFVAESKSHKLMFVVPFIAFLYYRIYFVHIDWLTEKINKVNDKHRLK